jgi:hypothetical protein
MPTPHLAEKRARAHSVGARQRGEGRGQAQKAQNDVIDSRARAAPKPSCGSTTRASTTSRPSSSMAYANQMGEIGAKLDQDLGISKGLPGIADNLVRFLGEPRGWPPLEGKLNAMANAPGQAQGGFGLMGMLGAQGVFGPQYTAAGQALASNGVVVRGLATPRSALGPAGLAADRIPRRHSTDYPGGTNSGGYGGSWRPVPGVGQSVRGGVRPQAEHLPRAPGVRPQRGGIRAQPDSTKTAASTGRGPVEKMQRVRRVPVRASDKASSRSSGRTPVPAKRSAWRAAATSVAATTARAPTASTRTTCTPDRASRCPYRAAGRGVTASPAGHRVKVFSRRTTRTTRPAAETSTPACELTRAQQLPTGLLMPYSPPPACRRGVPRRVLITPTIRAGPRT